MLRAGGLHYFPSLLAPWPAISLAGHPHRACWKEVNWETKGGERGGLAGRAQSTEQHPLREAEGQTWDSVLTPARREGAQWVMVG